MADQNSPGGKSKHETMEETQKAPPDGVREKICFTVSRSRHAPLASHSPLSLQKVSDHIENPPPRGPQNLDYTTQRCDDSTKNWIPSTE